MPAVISHPAVRTVAPPAEEEAAISLSGASWNPVSESWLQVIAEPRSGAAHCDAPELWTRNVSRPTLRPFLPDRAKATGAAMIVAPGGAFVGLAIEREGYSVARWLNQLGVAAFVLKYRVAPTAADWQKAQQDNAQMGKRLNEGLLRSRTERGTLSDLFSQGQRDAMAAAREDALEAVRWVRSHSNEFGLETRRVGLMGFSAGGMVTIDVALTADAGSRPDIIAPIYCALPKSVAVPAGAPPAFVAVAGDDLLVYHCLEVYEAWRASGAAAEMHIFESGGHGFGVLRQGRSSDHWTGPFEHWLSAHRFAARGRDG
jgi:acetyl esterase/lipase